MLELREQGDRNRSIQWNTSRISFQCFFHVFFFPETRMISSQRVLIYLKRITCDLCSSHFYKRFLYQLGRLSSANLIRLDYRILFPALMWLANYEPTGSYMLLMQHSFWAHLRWEPQEFSEKKAVGASLLGKSCWVKPRFLDLL